MGSNCLKSSIVNGKKALVLTATRPKAVKKKGRKLLFQEKRRKFSTEYFVRDFAGWTSKKHIEPTQLLDVTLDVSHIEDHQVLKHHI